MISRRILRIDSVNAGTPEKWEEQNRVGWLDYGRKNSRHTALACMECLLAPNAKLRREIILPPVEQKAGASTDCAHVQGEPARLSWARLLKRLFDVDIEP